MIRTRVAEGDKEKATARLKSVLEVEGATDKAKHTRAAVAFGIALLLIGYAIPWTRPMFRFGV